MTDNRYSDLTYIDKVKKNQKVRIALGAALVVGIVVLERKRVNRIVEGFVMLIGETEELSQAAVQDTMWRSFDEGVRYGLTLAKEGVVALKEGEGSQYAFGMFDKAS